MSWEEHEGMLPDCPPPGEGVHQWLYHSARILAENGVADVDEIAETLCEGMPETRRNMKEARDAAQAAVSKEAPTRKAKPAPEPKPREVKPAEPKEKSGDTWEDFLLNCYESGEVLCIAPEKMDRQQGRGTPDEAKRIWMERDALIQTIRDRGGKPSHLFSPTGETLGVYLCANPMPDGVRKKDSATAYRYALAEWDSISESRQWAIIEESGIPYSAITHSGGKSLHLLVPVNAQDADEYAEKVALLHSIMAGFKGGKVDKANKDASRYTRFPDANRNGKSQTLITATGNGADFEEWAETQEFLRVNAGVERWTFEELAEYVPDPADNLLGNGALRRGSMTTFTGPTGMGKSVLVTQFAMAMAAGVDLFQDLPEFLETQGPLRVPKQSKVVYVQAENEPEVMQRNQVGVSAGLGRDSLNGNLVTYRHFGGDPEGFTKWLRVVVRHEKPDVVVLDPYTPYIGGSDINDAAAFNEWKNLMFPLMNEAGFALLLVCHTGKPRADALKRQAHEKIYNAAGTSLLSNATRFGIELEMLDPENHRYLLTFSKNADRAGVYMEDGSLVREFVLEQASDRSKPFWNVSRDQSLEVESAKAAGQRIMEWRVANPKGTKHDCADALGISMSSVYRHWKDVKIP